MQSEIGHKRAARCMEETPQSANTKHNAVIEIKLSQVPEYLHDSELYKSFCENQEEGEDLIMVPNNCMKQCTAVNDPIELINLLESLRYWISSALPEELITFCLKNREVSCVLHLFDRELKQLSFLTELIFIMWMCDQADEFENNGMKKIAVMNFKPDTWHGICCKFGTSFDYALLASILRRVKRKPVVYFSM